MRVPLPALNVFPMPQSNAIRIYVINNNDARLCVRYAINNNDACLYVRTCHFKWDE